MTNKTLRAVSALLAAFIALCSLGLPVFAEDAAQITWAQVTYADGNAFIEVITPVELLDVIAYYEYRENEGSWTPVLTTNTHFELVRSSDRKVTVKYVTFDGFESPELVLDIVIPDGHILTEDEFGVSAKLPEESAIGPGSVLVVKQITDGAYYEAAKMKASVNSFVLLDAAFLTDGEPAEPDSEIRWTIPLPAKYRGDVCVLYSLAPDGTFTVLRYDPKGVDLEFTAPYAGMFLIIDAHYMDGVEPGDVDNDKNLTAADARLALRSAIGLVNLMHWALEAADVDGDSDVTAADARIILRRSIGLE